MPRVMTINVSDEVDKAIQKKAAADGITEDELIQNQLEYYIACALYRSFPPNTPVNCPGLSITDRLEVYAVMVNDGEEAARQKVRVLLSL